MHEANQPLLGCAKKLLVLFCGVLCHGLQSSFQLINQNLAFLAFGITSHLKSRQLLLESINLGWMVNRRGIKWSGGHQK